MLLASSGVEALGNRDAVFLFSVANCFSSVAPFSPLSVTGFDLHGDDFWSQTLVAFTSPEKFHSSVAESSFSVLVVTKSHCLEEPAGACPPFVFWFHGVASGRPPSSGLFDSEGCFLPCRSWLFVLPQSNTICCASLMLCIF